MNRSSLRVDSSRLVLTMVLASLALLLAAPAAAQREAGERPHGPRRHGPPPMHRMLERHADRLGLDEAEQVAIRRIADESREASSAAAGELRGAHDELRALLSEEQPDESAIMEQAEAIGLLQIEMHKSRLRTMLQIRALLTSEQRQELVRIREEERPPRRDKKRRGRFGDGTTSPPER